jgi:hypothetical protein
MFDLGDVTSLAACRILARSYQPLIVDRASENRGNSRDGMKNMSAFAFVSSLRFRSLMHRKVGKCHQVLTMIRNAAPLLEDKMRDTILLPDEPPKLISGGTTLQTLQGNGLFLIDCYGEPRRWRSFDPLVRSCSSRDLTS